jgi:hypothetical protein
LQSSFGEAFWVKKQNVLPIAVVTAAIGHPNKLRAVPNGRRIGTERTNPLKEGPELLVSFASYKNPPVERFAPRIHNHRERGALAEVEQNGGLRIAANAIKLDHKEPPRARVAQRMLRAAAVLGCPEFVQHRGRHNQGVLLGLDDFA